ncbi:PGG domain-containing protein [Cynara cardunculus var. scolymus]|uniref:PGG domain-containing protein n=1 Tax=Cynara cardunculus var. scolymus TaxID=59895 RepID=A0A124SHI3_CYNCS|nr:PGG domain-containing protein [Cynara cardunculus var. scolymus]
MFNGTHEQSAKEGKQWLKDRATSGLIVATLIATIVFTFTITIPNRNNSGTKLPVFVVFAVLDALALFHLTIVGNPDCKHQRFSLLVTEEIDISPYHAFHMDHMHDDRII